MKRSLIIALVAIIALLIGTQSFAQAVGSVTVALGPVKVFPKNSDQGSQAKPTMSISIGDRIETGAGGRVKVFFTLDNSVLQLGEDTTFVIQDLQYDESKKIHSGLFRVIKGKARVIINKVFGIETNARIETPTAVAGVTGTSLIVAYDEPLKQSTVLLMDGKVRVNNPSWKKNFSRNLTKGQITFVKRRQVPNKPRLAKATEVESLMKATEVPGPSPTDLGKLNPRNLTDDPVSLSRGDVTDTGEGEKEPLELGERTRDESTELEPVAPKLQLDDLDDDDDDFMPDDDDDDFEDDDDDDRDAETSIEIDFPDEESDEKGSDKRRK